MTSSVSWLTKSRFLSGLQCAKRLWSEVHFPLDLVASPNLQILQGRELDFIVQGLSPGMVISRDDGMIAAIAKTAKVMEAGAPEVLYQPAFRAVDLAVTADVVRRVGDELELIEVKATTEVKEHHLPDAAFQAMVMGEAGVPVQRVFIGHIDSEFVLRRAGEYQGLVVETNITEEVRGYLPVAAERASELQRVMSESTVPNIAMGAQCSDPYPCPFVARCTAEREPVVEYSVEILPRGGAVVEQLLADGYLDLREVPASRLTSPVHLRVHAATISGVPYFDVGATKDLRAIAAPFAYLDFETIGMAVPKAIGTRPYEQVPFQWSVHVEHSDSDVEHHEYLAIESFGEFQELAQGLRDALPSTGPVFAYNASFEAGILRRLADRVSSHAIVLRSIADRLVDLLPIARKAYYHRDMQGSWSIKKIMPTISPDMGYEHLDEVQEGGGAQLAFLELRGGEIDRERARTLRQALLKYCRHDTWSMVVLRRFLCGEGLGAQTTV